VGLSSFPHAGLRTQLTENEAAVFDRYQKLIPSKGRGDELNRNTWEFSEPLDTGKNVKRLHNLGLHSLARLLSLPSEGDHIIQVKSLIFSYEIIDNKKGLKALKDRLLDAEVWAIDTESSGRDPHSATLFGIAFSNETGWTSYVPLLEHDLKDISPQEVLSVIRSQLADKEKKFIGHNIKYDYLLLRRNGIHLKSIFFDTMLAAFECYGDLEFLNLGFLSEKLLGKGKSSYREMLGKNDSPWDIPISKLADHASRDVETTFQLYKILQKEMGSKGVTRQYFDLTLPLCRTLGDLEYSGIKVYKDKLNRIRDTLVKKINELKHRTNATLGRDINIDSDDEVKNYLFSSLGFPEWENLNRPFTAFLEYLGIKHDIPRMIVQYRRLLKEVHSIDVILKAIKNNRIFPIFSQVKQKSGLLTAKQPDFLDTQNLRELSLCFEQKVRPFFKDPLCAIKRIQMLSGDGILKKDISNAGGNAYLDSHPAMREKDSNSLFLSMLTGTPEAKIVNWFLIDRENLIVLRKEIESRYERLFSFLDKFKRESFERGFSEVEGKRKYLVGLRSPNLEKRRKAEQFALRWLIEV